jgi:hypothetical protein
VAHVRRSARKDPRDQPAGLFGQRVRPNFSRRALKGSTIAARGNGRPQGDGRKVPNSLSARQSISRVLSAPEGTGRPFLWDASCDAPHATNPGGGIGTSLRLSRAYTRDTPAAPTRSCSRWGLPCHPCCQGRGALLPHRFALTRGTWPAEAGPSCTGGLFSVALSLGSPPPAVSRHRVPMEPGLSSTNGIAPPAAAVQLSGRGDLRPRGQPVKRSGKDGATFRVIVFRVIMPPPRIRSAR